MIISHKYKCIYIRIPKTGSTSVESFFKEIDPDCISSEDIPPYGHETSSQLRDIYGHTVWNSYYKFTFIRNPYSWYKSYYSDLLNYSWDENNRFTVEGKGLSLVLTPDYSLPDAVDGILHEKHILVLQTLNDFWFYSNIHGSRMDDYVTQVSWIDLPVNFIGRTEFLQEDFKDVCMKLGIPHKELDYLNKSESINYTISEQAEKLISVLAYKDFDIYYNIKKNISNRY